MPSAATSQSTASHPVARTLEASSSTRPGSKGSRASRAATVAGRSSLIASRWIRPTSHGSAWCWNGSASESAKNQGGTVVKISATSGSRSASVASAAQVRRHRAAMLVHRSTRPLPRGVRGGRRRADAVTGSGPVTAASTPRTRPPAGAEGGPMRLHVGSGPARLDGWLNVDRQDLPEVDLVADVTAGLPVGDGEAEAVFAEHFLEHLALDDAVASLRETHRGRAPGGWLRLTPPNLDWVVATHYVHLEDPLGKALGLNLGFHGWSHRFLWNQALLGEAIAACGFEAIAWRRPGESGVPFLRELER